MADKQDPGKVQDTEQAARAGAGSGGRQQSGGGVFSDGSTQAEQDARVKAAEEANAETTRYADEQRKAQSGS